MTILVPARPPATPSPALASPRPSAAASRSPRATSTGSRRLSRTRGRGCVLVPGSASLNYSVPASGTRTLRWRAYQRYPCIQRSTSCACTARRWSPGEHGRHACADRRDRAGVLGQRHHAHPGTTCWLLEDAVTQFEGEVDISLDIINGSASTAITVDATTVIELPRVARRRRQRARRRPEHRPRRRADLLRRGPARASAARSTATRASRARRRAAVSTRGRSTTRTR